MTDTTNNIETTESTDLDNEKVSNELKKQLEKMRREKEMQVHNMGIDYAKAYKEAHSSKFKAPQILEFKQAVVEELVIAWSKQSLILRIPGVVQGGIAVKVAEFFKNNIRHVPYLKTYSEMEDWIFNCSNYLLAQDKIVFDFLRPLISTTTEFKNDAKEANSIGSSSAFLRLFQRDTVCFVGRELWSVFVSNETIHKDPSFDLEHDHDTLTDGRLGKFRNTTIFTDAFRAPQAKCLQTDESIFVTFPMIMTKESPILKVTATVTMEENNNGVVYEGLDFYKALEFRVEGAEFVSLYCKRARLTS